MDQMPIEEYVVETTVKNPERVKKRRAEIVAAAVKIFSEKGFHDTTTREIADLAGINSGTMFQYVKTKQDILYLVSCHIHSLVEQALFSAHSNELDPMKKLEKNVTALYKICDEVSDYVVLLYQETASLEKQARRSFLSRELRLCTFFENELYEGINLGVFKVDRDCVPLIADDILVQAEMWAFRRWSLAKKYTLEQFIEKRIQLLKALLM